MPGDLGAGQAASAVRHGPSAALSGCRGGHDLRSAVAGAPPVPGLPVAAALDDRSDTFDRPPTLSVPRYSGYSTIARQGRGCGAGLDTGFAAGGMNIDGMVLSRVYLMTGRPGIKPVARRSQVEAGPPPHQCDRLIVSPLTGEIVHRVEEGSCEFSGEGVV
ncbi:MAG: hypothetical protein QOD35_636 [Nocardioidaceae bacterium]|nr:hypothetical protein [Nocardioidaceae bacterium]